MQVTCPSCGARYAVDPTAIGPAGRTVQCVRCNHRWREKSIAPMAQGPLAPVVPPLPRAVADAEARPSYANKPGSTRLATPPPTTIHWERWLAAALVVLVVLAAAAFAYRDEIQRSLPPEWQPYFSLDAIRGLLRQ